MKEYERHFIIGTAHSIKQDLDAMKRIILSDPDHDQDQKIHMISRIQKLEGKLDEISNELTRVKPRAEEPCITHSPELSALSDASKSP